VTLEMIHLEEHNITSELILPKYIPECNQDETPGKFRIIYLLQNISTKIFKKVKKQCDSRTILD
jgi:hypothetical protein